MHYGVLVGVSTGYPPVAGRLHTRYAPVRRSPAAHCWAPLPLDLHVLSLPLAFILSQDQTLHCKNCLLLPLTRLVSPPPGLCPEVSDTRYLIFPIVSMYFCFQGASLFHCRSPVESGCKDTTIFRNTKIFFHFFFLEIQFRLDDSVLEDKLFFINPLPRPPRLPQNRPENPFSAQNSGSPARLFFDFRCMLLCFNDIRVILARRLFSYQIV